MPWYFRKSIGFGISRVNFSKSGISYSFGVKGARINTGPRGTYVSFGSHGIYYRKKIATSSGAQTQFSEPVNDDSEPIAHTITSAPIAQLTDADSREFIDELSSQSEKNFLLKVVRYAARSIIWDLLSFLLFTDIQY